MPSSNERALEKAKSIPCDGLILDLEDAVAPDAKPAARDAACAAAASGEYGAREVTIRINGIGTEWHAADIVAAAEAGPAAIVVPKVDTADQVRGLATALEWSGAPEHTRLWAMIETPEAIFNVREIATAHERLAVLVMGTNDLVKELYAQHVPGRAPLLTSLSMSLARGAGGRCCDPRRRLQRREGHRRLPRGVPAGPGDGLRRQDPDPPRPGRGRQRHLRPVPRRRRGGPGHPPGLGGRGRLAAWSPTTAG